MILPSCSPLSMRSWAAAASDSGKTLSTSGLTRPDVDQLVDGLEVLSRPHRGAEDRQLLPPDSMQCRRRVRAGRGAADHHAASLASRLQALLPGRLADVLDHDVRAVAAGGLLHGRHHVLRGVVHLGVGLDLGELLVAARGDDRPRAESPGDRVRRGRDAAADAPDEDPLAFAEPCAGNEHAVGGLVDEREGGGLLEAQAVGNRVDVRRRHSDQLGMRAVRVLADDRDLVAVLHAGVDQHALAVGEAGAVGAEDARLGDGGPSLTDPEVEVVQRGRSQLDEDVSRPGLGIGRVLVAEHVGPAVLVDADCLHRSRW